MSARRTRTAAHPTTRGRAVSRPVWNPEQVRALGTTTDVVTAGEILGLSRNTAYRLAHANAFPVPVLRAGTQYRVPVAGLLAALHIAAEPTAPVVDLTGPGSRSVDVDRQNRCPPGEDTDGGQ
jgi:hypothetical protein